MVMHI